MEPIIWGLLHEASYMSPITWGLLHEAYYNGVVYGLLGQS